MTIDTFQTERLRSRLYELETEHRDLDDVIQRLQETTPFADQLQIQRLKKRKLGIKDQIEQIKSQLIPDLNA